MVVDIQIKEAVLTRLRVNLYHLPVVVSLSLPGVPSTRFSPVNVAMISYGQKPNPK